MTLLVMNARQAPRESTVIRPRQKKLHWLIACLSAMAIATGSSAALAGPRVNQFLRCVGIGNSEGYHTYECCIPPGACPQSCTLSLLCPHAEQYPAVDPACLRGCCRRCGRYGNCGSPCGSCGGTCAPCGQCAGGCGGGCGYWGAGAADNCNYGPVTGYYGSYGLMSPRYGAPESGYVYPPGGYGAPGMGYGVPVTEPGETIQEGPTEAMPQPSTPAPADGARKMTRPRSVQRPATTARRSPTQQRPTVNKNSTKGRPARLTKFGAAGVPVVQPE